MAQLNRKLRIRIFERDGWRCFYCGGVVECEPWDGQRGGISQAQMKAWACVDHLTPERRGGSNGDDNLVTACRLCNGKKASATLEEFRERVQRESYGHGYAINLLNRVLLASPSPFDETISEAIEWHENHIPTIVFAGELGKEAAA